MTAEESFEKLKNLIENSQASKQVLGFLNEGIEVRIIIGDAIECAVYQKDGKPHCDARAAVNPRVTLHIRPETVEILANKTKDEAGEISLNSLKEILAGHIQIQVPGGLSNLLHDGYQEIMENSEELKAFAKKHLGEQVPKILSSIKRLWSHRQN